MLVKDGVKKPGRGRLRLRGRRLAIGRGEGQTVLTVGRAGAALPAAYRLPVSQLPPQLVLHNAGFQVCLALLVPPQDLSGLNNLLRADHPLAVPAGQQHSSHFRRHSSAGGNAGSAGCAPGRSGRLLSEDICHFFNLLNISCKIRSGRSPPNPAPDPGGRKASA